MEIVINKLLGLICLIIGIFSLRSWLLGIKEGERLVSITSQQRFKGGILLMLLGLLLFFNKFRFTEL